MRHSRGFTLVELLVVIGIIAVLISILLPSLARARQQATNLSCQANLRSIGQGLQFYALDNKGKLPKGEQHAPSWSWVRYTWVTATAPYLGSPTFTENNDYWTNDLMSKVFACPDVLTSDFPSDGIGGLSCYTGNTRAFYSDWRDAQKQTPLAIQNSAEKMLLWDGGMMYASWGWSRAPYTNEPQMGGASGPSNSWAMWSDPQDPALGTTLPLDQVVHLGNGTNWTSNITASTMQSVNKDLMDGSLNEWNAPDSFAFQRYRHLNNASANFLFFDGHVEARRIGTVTVRELSIFPSN